MKSLNIQISDSLHFKFKNRCQYHEFTSTPLITQLITSFVNGKYDEELGIVEASKGEFHGN